MTRNTTAHKASRIQFRSFLPFLMISFGLAWGILGLYIILPERMEAVFGQLTGNHPLFFLAVYAPAIAAFILVARSGGLVHKLGQDFELPGILYLKSTFYGKAPRTRSSVGRSYEQGRSGGLAGLQSFLGRVLLWRCSAVWYAFLVIGIPLIFICGSAIRGNLFSEPFPFTSMQALFVGLFISAVKGPMEEFGWRGLALPLLQRKFVPIWAGLILGVIWGLWHFPAFLLSGTQQSEWSFSALLDFMGTNKNFKNNHLSSFFRTHQG
jgi:membrane protease YdiL (CAAX protease family)